MLRLSLDLDFYTNPWEQATLLLWYNIVNFVPKLSRLHVWVLVKRPDTNYENCCPYLYTMYILISKF